MIQQTGRTPARKAAPVSATFGQDRLEVTLRQAHVHVSRYFRAWLRDEAEAAALAEELSIEALVRIARMPVLPEGCADSEVVSSWLSVARDLALEVIGR